MNYASQDIDMHLSILRQRLQHPTDYELALNYFLEEFGGDQKFIAMGKVEAAPLLVTVLGHIARKALGKAVRMERARISVMPQQQFHHGSAAVDGRAVIMFYFRLVLG